MKAEQVCRFRTDSVGYAICSKSSGITEQNEKNFSDVFNQTMEPLFIVNGKAKIRKKILTYTKKGDDFFIATSTMRTDISGRNSIFTHAYVMSNADYQQTMSNDPAKMLSIKVDTMLEAEPSNKEMECANLAFQNETEMDLKGLLQKYHLDENGYAQLLLGAYKATADGESLIISISNNYEPIQTIRELAYCVSVGMPPAIRGKLTLSSGSDARTSLCLSTPEGGMVSTAARSFNLDNCALSDIGNYDEKTQDIFKRIVQMNEPDRINYLKSIQQNLEKIILPEFSSFELIISVCYIADKCIAGDELRVLGGILSCGDNQPGAVNYKNYYNIISALLKKMNGTSLNQYYLSRLVDRYMKEPETLECQQSKLVFDQTVIDSLQLISIKDCEKQLENLVIKTFTVKVTALIKMLLRRMFSESAALRNEVAHKILDSALKGNIVSLIDECVVLTDAYDFNQRILLIQDILDYAKSRAFNECECIILSVLLERLVDDDTASCMRRAYCEMLDSHFADYDEPLRDACINYLLGVRMSGQSYIDDRTSELMRIRNLYPEYFAEIEKTIRCSGYLHSELWENFQSIRCFNGQENVDELIKICDADNMFMDGSGAFEARVVSLWKKSFAEAISKVKSLREREELFESNLKKADAAKLSQPSRQRIKADVSSSFLRCIRYQDLFDDSLMLPQEALIDTTNSIARKKVEIYRCCCQIKADPRKTEPLCRIFMGNKYTSSELMEIADALYLLAVRILKKKKFLSWDLFLLSFYKQEKDKWYCDCESLMDELSNMLGYINPRYAYTKESYILNCDETVDVRRSIRRLSLKRKEQFFKEAADELKSEKGTILDSALSLFKNKKNRYDK